ncbi:MAG: porin family protein [Bacteroidota bacterium]
MKKLLLCLGMAFPMLMLSAQDAALSKTSRFSFYLSVEAGYSGVKSEVKDGSTTMFGYDENLTSEEVRPGYAVGMSGAYQLGRHWDLELGLNFGAWRAYGKGEYTIYDLTGLAVQFSRERHTVRQDLLRIPLQMRFYFGRPERRARFFISFGGQAAYITGQNNFSHSIYGTLGQEPNENFYSFSGDLAAEYYEIQRWQWSLLGGIGVQMDRASLSIQRTWALGNTYEGEYTLLRYYPDFCGEHGQDNIFCDYSANQFRQTSLRFTYRLF